ncbi:MAG: type I restriction enzyme HsdR N-terminal domain-containing protein [Bacteroidales bacterium]|nr:type I restriction enzyme HsdR N-terminal domain-containing protein [Bacteroidales bacterium]
MKTALNLPAFPARIRKTGTREEIFDVIRRKYVTLTPEEWVRQHFVHYLVNGKSVPATLIGVEVNFRLNRLVKRADIVVYSRSGIPLMLVECKAPGVDPDQGVFDQAARYNRALNVSYLVITNGLVHYCCRVDLREGSCSFLEEIPRYPELINLEKP